MNCSTESVSQAKPDIASSNRVAANDFDGRSRPRVTLRSIRHHCLGRRDLAGFVAYSIALSGR